MTLKIATNIINAKVTLSVCYAFTPKETKPILYFFYFQIKRIDLRFVKHVTLNVDNIPIQFPYLKKKKQNPYQITLLSACPSVCLSRLFISATRGGMQFKFKKNIGRSVAIINCTKILIIHLKCKTFFLELNPYKRKSTSYIDIDNYYSI